MRPSTPGGSMRRCVDWPAVAGTGTVAASALAWSVSDSVAEVAAFVPESVTDDSARPEFVFTEPPLPPAPASILVSARGWWPTRRCSWPSWARSAWCCLSRADHRDAAATGSSLLAPQNGSGRIPAGPATASAPPTRTVVVRDPSWPGPGAAAKPRPGQHAAPWLVQSRQSAPLAPAPQRAGARLRRRPGLDRPHPHRHPRPWRSRRFRCRRWCFRL